eukprot:CAMPEP_0117032442 /NCGR_PEP_ID=MMETSP0472-20121206/23255_1 /TAXON_ID=693140 ORGANISM="Tiarina fusus, Strain LIS" /NCGR_SAMPLE_ID=MMETSP0472 /ASSEMBLY_ACC=CAM_ASM_000603 /LENGTH=129 /DNA_ID=CAMNT_0004741081 /DNA_START=514 /DNA_END=902 /DNA_ORIENTATION=-
MIFVVKFVVVLANVKQAQRARSVLDIIVQNLLPVDKFAFLVDSVKIIQGIVSLVLGQFAKLVSLAVVVVVGMIGVQVLVLFVRMLLVVLPVLNMKPWLERATTKEIEEWKELKKIISARAEKENKPFAL